MGLFPQTRFSMCSLYSRDGRAICACFLGKGKQTVEDLCALNSEALLWSGGGSGVISLADLEAELNGKRSWDAEGPSDKEFMEECHRRGMKIFGVVFTAQGYEVSVELNDDESEILSFGKITGKGKSGTWGLREFYSNRYPKIYKSFREYHPPERLSFIDSFIDKELEGADFLERTACRDLRGNKSICYWINGTGLPRDFQYTNYFMCKNSPVWREHLKTMIEMQIDAGFDGVQFDEPAVSVEVGGTRAGFCEHCRERFSSYMVERYGEKFADFDYSALLQERGAGVFSELAFFKGMPYWEDWKRSLVVDARRNFTELVDHARAYAEKQGREVVCAANFFNWLPHHLMMADEVDVFALEYDPGLPPERFNLIYAEIGRALDDNKPLTMVPHIAFATHLRERAKDKKDVNLLRYLIAEAAFAGGDFMVPYSCICITGPGAYYPPVDEISGYLGFVKELRERFRGAEELSQAAVVLSFPSYFWSFDFLNMPGRHFSSLEAVTRFLQILGIQYRVVIWGDDEFMPEGSVGRDRGEVSGDEFLILPQVSHMTEGQVERLREFIEHGGRALVIGKCGVRDGQNKKRDAPPFSLLKPGENNPGKGSAFLSPDDVPLKSRALSRRGKDKVIEEWLSGMGVSVKIKVINPTGHAPLVRASKKDGKLLVKLLNPNYDYQSDTFSPVANAEILLDRNFFGEPEVFRMYTPEGEAQDIKGEVQDRYISFKLPDFFIYAVLEETG